MQSDNKQNKAPNQKQLPLFSNPYICSKVHNKKLLEKGIVEPTAAQSSPSSKQREVIQFDSYNEQFSNHLNTNNTSNKQKQVPQTIKCEKHQQNLANLFCSDCLSYNLCKKCIPDCHLQHQIIHFNSYQSMIAQTKELLLQNLQQTLKQLKSKENQVKNRVHQVNLVKNSLRTLQQEIISIISGFFRDIQGKLITSVEKQQQHFNQEVQEFFKSFNKINDQLRESLMKILDGQIDIKQFDKSMIIKNPPISPNFMEYKNNLERFKKVFKIVKNDFSSIKSSIQQAIGKIDKQQSHNSRAQNQTNYSKLDKYIQNNTHKNQKVNYSFLKTLKLLQIPGQASKILKTKIC